MNYCKPGIIASALGATALLALPFTASAIPPPAGPSASLSFVSDSAAGEDTDVVSWTANGIGGAGSEVYVKVFNTDGNPLDGVTVALSSGRGGRDTIAGIFGGGATQISSDGGFAGFYVSSIHAGAATFSATITSEFPTVIVTDTLTINWKSVVEPSASTVTATPSSALANQSALITLTITARDGSGNALANRGVSVSANGATVSGVSAATDAGGKAAATLTSCTAGSPILAITVDGVQLTPPAVSFTFHPGVHAGFSTVAPAIATSPSDNETTLSVVVAVKNLCNVPISGATVTLASSRPSADTIAPANRNTDALGQATFTVKSGTAGSSTYTATANDILLSDDQITVTYTAAAAPTPDDVSPNPAQSQISAIPLSVVANNADTATITVTVRNGAGQALAGKVVTLASSRVADTIAILNGATNAIGQANFTVKSWGAGVSTLTARVPEYGMAISTSATVTFVAQGSEPAPATAPASAPAPASPSPGATPTGGARLVKLSCPSSAESTHPCRAVYYVGSNGVRHAFPNEKIYKTWYADFSGVEVVTATQMAAYRLGKNVTYRPGVRMVKFATVSKTYAVTRGGALRWVTSEDIARSLYGTAWNTRVDDISDAFYIDYSFAGDIIATDDYLIAAELAAAQSIDANF